MSLPWIKVQVVLPNHPKLQRLEKLLGVEDALGVMVRLWCWTATYYPDGIIPGHATQEMERVVIEGRNVTVTGGNETVTDALVTDRKSTRLNSSHSQQSRMPSSA